MEKKKKSKMPDIKLCQISCLQDIFEIAMEYCDAKEINPMDFVMKCFTNATTTFIASGGNKEEYKDVLQLILKKFDKIKREYEILLEDEEDENELQ